jgi:hypothetical protein
VVSMAMAEKTGTTWFAFFSFGYRYQENRN